MMSMTRKSGAAAILVLLLAALAPVVQAEDKPAKTPLTADILWQIKRLGSPAISPDGVWAAVPVTSYDVKTDKALTDLFLVPTAGGEARQLTTHESSETNPAFSPDGKWISFEAKRGEDENPQIYLISTSGGEARRLTNVPTGAFAAKWFPDSKRVAFLSRVFADLKTWEEMEKRLKERKDSKMTAKVWDKAPIRYWDHWLDDREAHIYTIGIDGGAPLPVTMGTGLQLSRSEPGVGSYDVSPDGGEIAFAADVDTTGVDSNNDVFVIPSSGGTPKNLTSDNPAGDDAPRYSPDGRFLAFGRQIVKGFYADRVRLMLHDRKTGQNAVVSEGWDRSASDLVWAADGKALFGAIDDAACQRVYRIDVATGRPIALTKDQSFSNLAVSKDGRVLVALRQGFSEPPTLVRVDQRAGVVTKLSTFNDALFATVELGRYESVTYKGSGGAEIQMWVIYPPGFDPAQKYPLFLILHGGPHGGVTDQFTFRWNAEVFAGWGYVAAWHNFHGSSGFGQAFADSINPDWATKPYQDTIAATRYFADQPWIDKDRMVAGGGSYGGYLSTLVLGRENPFKALVAHAAVYNVYTQYGSDYGASKRRHGEFWQDPQQFTTISPHLQAASFKTPTLVVHGELDYRVPNNHGIELFNTLQNRGVRSRLIYYPNENHWVLKPQNSLFWYQSVRDWFKEFVAEGPK